MEKTKRFTLDLTQSQLDTLRDLAKKNGYTIGRGPLANSGSIQKMATAIADGTLSVITDDSARRSCSS